MHARPGSSMSLGSLADRALDLTIAPGDTGGGKVLTGRSDKVLHVSPFMGMDHEYDWRVSRPGERIAIHIESRQEGARAFDATLLLERRELSSRSLASATLRHPLHTLHVLARIYGQALRLKLRGVSVHPRPSADAS
jgi:uncharacterized protein